MKKTSFDLDLSFDLPNFDGLLDDLDLDVSLDGIDLDLDLIYLTIIHRTEREQRENRLLKIVEFSTGIARTPANPTPQKRSFWSP